MLLKAPLPPRRPTFCSATQPRYWSELTDDQAAQYTHRKSPMSEKQSSSPDPVSGGSPLRQPAHTLTYEAVIKELGTRLDDGLTPDEASLRLQQYGPNKLDEGEGVSVLKILVRQVANAMMLVKGPTIIRDDISKSC